MNAIIRPWLSALITFLLVFSLAIIPVGTARAIFRDLGKSAMFALDCGIPVSIAAEADSWIDQNSSLCNKDHSHPVSGWRRPKRGDFL